MASRLPLYRPEKENVLGGSNFAGASDAAFFRMAALRLRRYVRRMETNELHRGRLIDHIHLVVSDLAKSRRFYSAVFEALKIPIGGEGPGFFWADEIFISDLQSPASAGSLTGRAHLAFQAPDQDTVERFHKAGLGAGGKDNGAPGPRSYHPGYYAAFLLDPDGNNIEAVFHGPAKRSSASVKITF